MIAAALSFTQYARGFCSFLLLLVALIAVVSMLWSILNESEFELYQLALTVLVLLTVAFFAIYFSVLVWPDGVPLS